MAKQIDLNQSVYTLVKQYPELKDIMADLGFTEVTKKAMLNSVGKVMTIPKGAKMKHISMIDVARALLANGFEPAGDMPAVGAAPSAKPSAKAASPMSDERKAMLKGYLKRLGDGEDLESVRADFVAHFSDVEASEIMEAEQELLAEGTPLQEVQQLCDVHSALFHGATREEQIANAEKEVAASMERKNAAAAPDLTGVDKNERARALAAIPGHPLRQLTRENDAFDKILAEARKAAADGSLTPELFAKVREISVHYAKKGDLLYPLLKVNYGISGPSDVMWTVDDEIRDELGSLAETMAMDDAWVDRFNQVLTRAEEMIYKESNILFPICAVQFTQAEWFSIYQDEKDYAMVFGVEREKWSDAEQAPAPAEALPKDGEIAMPGGHMTVEQLTALLNTIPMEISFIDADNINRFFNEGPKVFKRPHAAIDREVFSCHPPKIEPMVRGILDSFRSGEKDSVPVWMEKNGRTMLVTYTAVRDRNGKYLGTVELIQDMEFAKAHFSEA
jgi:DUF438 domain-containing protein